MNKKNRIPDFASRKEMAEWFDTHDVGDYLDELEVIDPRDIRVSAGISGVVVQLDINTSAKLKRLSRVKRVDPVMLARTWITDQVNKELKHSL